MILKNVIVEDIDMNDYPDFSDAFIVYAEHENGVPFRLLELEKFEKDFPEENYKLILESIN